MIIAEVCVKTKPELKVLFTRLNDAGYTWYSGKNLLEWINIPRFCEGEGVVYLCMTDRKLVLWSSRSVPRSEWSDW